MTSTKYLIAFLSLQLAFPPHLLAAVADVKEQQVSLEAQLQQMRRLISFARDMRGHIDRSAFDVDAALDSLDYEAQPIIDFVKNSVGFEQYPGVMRGPAGTLASRAGNALDQSLLLAKLLRDAGFEARIAGAQLTQEQARKLLLEMKVPKPPEGMVGNADAMLGTLGKHGFLEAMTDADKKAFTDFVKQVPAVESAPYYEKVIETGKFVSDALKEAGVSFSNHSGRETLEQEAADYYWVQFKEFDADPWKDLHPAFSGDSPFESLEMETTYTQAIPEELQHRVRFQVFIERSFGGRLEVKPVTRAWERPVANLIATPLSFSNMPDSLMSSPVPGVDLITRLEAAEFFVPMFGTGMADGASFFDLQGNIIDPMAANNMAAGVFKEIGEGFGRAAGDLGGEKLTPKLTAQWMEFTFISPGGEEQTFRRTTFDRIGPAARANGSVPDDLKATQSGDVRSLFQRHTFMVTAAATPRGQAMDYTLDRLIRVQPALEVMMAEFAGPGTDPAIANSALADIPPDWAGHLMLFTAMDGANRLSPDHRIYRSAPGIVVHSEGPLAGESSISAIDVVRNPRRAISLKADALSHDPAMMIPVGVWETEHEGVAFQNAGKFFNTSGVFADARKQGVDFRVIRPGESLDGLGVTDDVNFHIDADLGRGFAVLVPEKATGLEHMGWWRISLDDGETLGQLGDGRGSVTVEELNAFALGYSIGMLAGGLFGCHQGYQDDGNGSRAACCVAANFAYFAVGYFGFNVLGNMAASAAGGAAYVGWDAALAIAGGSMAFDTISFLADVCPK